MIFSVGNLNIYVHEETSWLVGSHFLPFWNVFESGSISPNNHVEGWHNHLNTISEKAHSNGFEIVNKKKIGLTGRSLRKTARLMVSKVSNTSPNVKIWSFLKIAMHFLCFASHCYSLSYSPISPQTSWLHFGSLSSLLFSC